MVVPSLDRARWTDADLLKAIASGDGAAFSALYRRHSSTVLAFLIRETRDREAAADLAAEVFATVLLIAGRYRPQGISAAPWLIGIARKKLLMSFRRGRVEAKARRRLGFQPLELYDDDLERIEAVADAGAGRLVALVERLPENERAAIRSHVLEERSYGEIAGELRCSEMVIRKRVSRGLGRVREQLNER
jgi:RNA polymerase sigma factor (sigma-70 family)